MYKINHKKYLIFVLLAVLSLLVSACGENTAPTEPLRAISVAKTAAPTTTAVNTPKPTNTPSISVKEYSMEVPVKESELGEGSVVISRKEIGNTLVFDVTAMGLNPTAVNFYLRQQYGIGNASGKTYITADNFFTGSVNNGYGGNSFMYSGKLEQFGQGNWMLADKRIVYSKPTGFQELIVTFRLS